MFQGFSRRRAFRYCSDLPRLDSVADACVPRCPLGPAAEPVGSVVSASLGLVGLLLVANLRHQGKHQS